MHTNENLCKSLNIGLYHRYKRDIVLTKNGVRKNKSKEENPYIFEAYVACVMESILGGKARVTKSSGDYGVDIRHTLPNGDLYLGQVKCYDPIQKISHSPISILHSNMVHEKAKGGYFITTSEYSENAILRANDLKVKLINGNEFAQYCLGLKKSWLEIEEKFSIRQYITYEWAKLYEEIRAYINNNRRA